MMMQDDIRPVIELLVESANVDTTTILKVVLDAIERECNGAETSTLDVYEEILNSLVRTVREER